MLEYVKLISIHYSVVILNSKVCSKTRHCCQFLVGYVYMWRVYKTSVWIPYDLVRSPKVRCEKCVISGE
jgi:hypothetical protein